MSKQGGGLLIEPSPLSLLSVPFSLLWSLALVAFDRDWAGLELPLLRLA